jgi:hypothetical protein
MALYYLRNPHPNYYLSHDSIASHREVVESGLDSFSLLGQLGWRQLSSLGSGQLSSLIQRLQSLSSESSLRGGSSGLRLNSQNSGDGLSDVLDLSELSGGTSRNLGDAELGEFALQFLKLLLDILGILGSELVSLNFNH